VRMPLRPAPTRIALATLSTAPVAAAILTGCGAESGTGGAGDPGPVHVHGLGVDPAGSSLYIATHGADDARRVGDSYQDTMGFTVVGARRFLGSGHLDLRTDLPPHLGVLGYDAGVTWSAPAQAAVAPAWPRGDVLYALGRDGTTSLSRDGGASWATFGEARAARGAHRDRSGQAHRRAPRGRLRPQLRWWTVMGGRRMAVGAAGTCIEGRRGVPREVSRSCG
jgi:hypothetical protein